MRCSRWSLNEAAGMKLVCSHLYLLCVYCKEKRVSAALKWPEFASFATASARSGLCMVRLPEGKHAWHGASKRSYR